MTPQAGIQIFNARGSCTMDSRCGLTRIVGIAVLGSKMRMHIPISNPDNNKIWAQLSASPTMFYAEAVYISNIEIWDSLQGITVTLPFRPNSTPDPEFPTLPYDENMAKYGNPRYVIYGFY